MNATEEAARLELRERLGAGARYDSIAAPARELAWARRGTAYFARKLAELPDGELAAPSLVPGWSRARVVAHVGYHARATARLVEAARLGAPEEALAEPEQQTEDVAFGATLPAHALRHLFKHSEVHLNVEWRDLPDAGWQARVRALDGRELGIRDTPVLRAQEIWLRAVDLDNGASFLDFPPDLVDLMLSDRRLAGIVGDCTLVVEDRSQIMTFGRGGPRISGRAPDLLRWLRGRGARRLSGLPATLSCELETHLILGRETTRKPGHRLSLGS